MPFDLRTTFRIAPHSEALLDGRVTSKLVNLQFIPVEPISRAFRRAIRDDEFDLTEMALITLAMAVDAGYPWIGLPIIVMRSLHHAALRTPSASPIQSPKDLVGRKVGVRAYSQTTGVWVRGILQREYGVGADQIEWLTMEDAHVRGFADPAYVHSLSQGDTLQNLFISGVIDAAIGDGKTSFADSRSVIPEPEKAAAEWHRRTGVVPVNHLIALRRDLLEQEPWLADELQRMFQHAKDLWQLSAAGTALEDWPYGRAAHETSIDLGLQFALNRVLTRKLFHYEDLVYTGFS